MATINGTFNSLIAGTLSGTIGTPGPTGATGATGATGPGVAAGGTAGQFLTKTTTGVDYATNWTTVNLSAYLTKAGNLAGLTSLSTARDNLNLGTANAPVFNGLTAQGSGSNAAQLSPTSLTLTQTGSGIFTIQPSQGIVFPDSTVQVTAYPGPVGATQWGSIGGTLSNQTDLYNALAAKLDSTTAASTYYLQTNPDGFLTDAPSDGSQYARQDGAWSVVTGGGGGSYLPLAGGTMTGPIVFDGTSGQYISKGNFDTSRGGNYGISLVCSIGYEFNWQAGWLTTTNQGTTTPRPLYLDSVAGTTLRAWNSTNDTGVEVSHGGVYSNNTDGTSCSLATAGVDITGLYDPLHDPAAAHLRVDGLEFRLTDDVPASVYGRINWQNEDGTGNYNYSTPGEAIGCYFADGSGTRIQGGYIRSFTAGEASEIVIDPSVGITFPDSTVQTTAGGAAVTNNNQLATTVTSTYTQYYIPFSDRNGIIVCQSGSPGVVLTDSSYGWTPGQQVLIVNNTSNSISVQASGATIVSVNSATYIVPNGVCAAVYIDTNLWVISGSLSN